MQNFQAPPLNASSPFGNASPLFKALSGESMQASPIQASPFSSPQNHAATNAPLTVGDVLPQLPPDLVRLNGLSPDQPVAISAQILDAALRSGQAALPIFEIYRVCPAMFTAPVSPQDPRLVPLPASKLPRLIASAQQVSAPNAGMSASPFGTAQPAASPFASAAPSPATTLPPRRNGPPPPLADVAREAAASLSLPGKAGTGAPVFPVSPFAAVKPAGNMGAEAAQASPFAVARPPEQTPAQPVSLFSTPNTAATSAASPFAAATSGGTPASPFQAFGVASGGAAPSPAPASESPFATLFGPKAVPTGQPAPDAPVRPSATGSSPFVPSPGSGPNLRIGLASLVRGYSVAELGFDPIMVPSWIMTSLPTSMVREWSQSPAPLVELGVLIDGVTDVGFRNVLNNARRDFQLRIPQEEVSAAMAGGAPPTLPNLANLGTGTPNFQLPPGAATMRVEPPAQAEVSPFASSPPAPVEPVSSSPFMAPAGFGKQEAASPVPLFSQSAPAPATAFQATPNAGFQTAAPPPLTNPFAAPPPLQQAPVFSPPPQEFTPRETPPSLQSPPPPPSEGLSSAELLGAPFKESANAFPPAPAIPVTNPFTGKAATNIVDVPEETPPPEPPRQQPAADRSAPPATRSPFIPPAYEPEEEPVVRQRPAPVAKPRPAAAASHTAPPALGIQPLETNPDQILLRALLGTDDELTPQRIVEMVCSLPGIAACVCLHGERAISHAGAHKPQAREFQRQATDLAHHLRTLAPLIGIEGAETFTLMSGDRLMTFCFPEGSILGVLHDADPSLGLRDKITLIARELSRMLD